jgi:hypothetical protein
MSGGCRGTTLEIVGVMPWGNFTLIGMPLRVDIGPRPARYDQWSAGK